MTDTTTKQAQAPVEGELVDHEETSIARQDGGALSTEGLAFRPDSVAILERAADLYKRGRKAMLGLTDPADWIAQKTTPATAMLTSSGALKMAPMLGIHVAPVPPATDLTPQEITVGGKRAWTVRGLVSSRLLGLYDVEIEATRREDEDFTGRSLDGAGAFTRKSDERAGSYEADVKSAARTLLRTKAVRECGFKKVPIADLAEAWGGKKRVEDIQGGHGFGSADGRRAQGVAEAGAQGGSEALWQELLRRTGGDTSAASSLLRDITANPPKFTGFTDPKRLTLDWQIDNARKKLAKHPIFGDGAKVQTEGAEREPGEDG